MYFIYSVCQLSNKRKNNDVTADDEVYSSMFSYSDRIGIGHMRILRYVRNNRKIQEKVNVIIIKDGKKSDIYERVVDAQTD